MRQWRVLRFLESIGVRAEGIDFVEQVISKIKEERPQWKVKEASILETGYADETFDCIFAFGLYHNLAFKDIVKALSETNRILVKGGVLCCSFRSDNLQNYILDKQKNHTQLGNKIHKINLKRKEILDLLLSNGYSVDRVFHVENIPFIYQFRILRHRSQKTKIERFSRVRT